MADVSRRPYWKSRKTKQHRNSLNIIKKPASKARHRRDSYKVKAKRGLDGRKNKEHAIPNPKLKELSKSTSKHRRYWTFQPKQQWRSLKDVRRGQPYWKSHYWIKRTVTSVFVVRFEKFFHCQACNKARHILWEKPVLKKTRSPEYYRGTHRIRQLREKPQNEV